MKTRGELPGEWRWGPLSDVADVIAGQSPPGTTYNADGNGLPFFQGKAEFGSIYPTAVKWCTAKNARVAEPGDVLISVRAPVGPTNLCQERSIIGRGLAAVRPRAGMPTLYLLHVLRATAEDLRSKATGTTFEAISGNQLRAHLIPIAPERIREGLVEALEQQLTRLDEALETMATSLRRGESLRRSLLNAAFAGRLGSDEP